MNLSKNFRDFILVIHIGLLLILLVSPLIVSKEFVNRYGNIIAYFMAIIIFSWSIFGKCPLSVIEGTDSHGSVNKFLKQILKINIKGYENIIIFIIAFLFTYTMYFYSKYNIDFLYYAVLNHIICILQMI